MKTKRTKNITRIPTIRIMWDDKSYVKYMESVRKAISSSRGVAYKKLIRPIPQGKYSMIRAIGNSKPIEYPLENITQRVCTKCNSEHIEVSKFIFRDIQDKRTGSVYECVECGYEWECVV